MRIHPLLPTILLLPALALCLPASGCSSLISAIESMPAAASSTPEDGLREALRIGTGRAVDRVGRDGGFLGDAALRIEVPEKLDDLSHALRVVGRGDLVDEFVTSMNRAAEAAAPLATDVFVDTIRGMTFADAMTIIRGSEHEATDYFRANAGPRLAGLFGPIVDRKLDEVGATRSFNELMERINRMPLVERPVFDLEQYVTGRALDGLFDALADEELRIRRDPAARTTELLRKYFGG